MAVMDLEKAISDIKLRIDESPRDMSEADTKATLIEPMLVALGWNTADVREVKREATTPDGKFADYVLFLNGRKYALLEAKALGLNIDKKYRIQFINYAQSMAIPIAVLTNGNYWEFNLATEAKLRADERTVERVAFSKCEPQEIAHRIRLCLKPSDRGDNALEEYKKAIWLPVVKKAWEKVVDTKLDRLYKLVLPELDIVEDGPQKVLRNCLKEILTSKTTEQPTSPAFHKTMQFKSKEISDPPPRTTQYVLDPKRLAKLERNWAKLPNDLSDFIARIRKMLTDAGFEERVYGYLTYFDSSGREAIALSTRTLKDPKVLLYPIKRVFSDYSGLSPEIDRLVEPYASAWFRTDFQVAIRLGEAKYGLAFLKHFLSICAAHKGQNELHA